MCAFLNVSRLSLVDSKIPCDKKRSMLRGEMEGNILSGSEETETVSLYLLNTVRTSLINRVRKSVSR